MLPVAGRPSALAHRSPSSLVNLSCGRKDCPESQPPYRLALQGIVSFQLPSNCAFEGNIANVRLDSHQANRRSHSHALDRTEEPGNRTYRNAHADILDAEPLPPQSAIDCCRSRASEKLLQPKAA